MTEFKSSDSWVPRDPSDPDAVALCLRPFTGVKLKLVVKKEDPRWVAWLWEGSDGLAYFSKQPAKGKPFVWATGRPLEQVLRANKSLAKLWKEQQKGVKE